MADLNTVTQKVLSGMAWEALSKLLVQVASWVTTIYVARLLVPEDYGLIATSGIYTGFLTLIGNLGFSAGLVNKKDISQEDQNGAFWLSLGLALSLYGFLYVAAPWLASFHEMPDLTGILRAAGLVLIISSISILPVSLALREMHFKYQALVQMVAQLVNAVSVLLFALWGLGAMSLVWSVILSQTVALLFYLPFLRQLPGLAFKLSEIQYLLNFSLKVMGSRIANNVTTSADVFVISTLLGQQATGYYSMAKELAMIPLKKIGQMFNRVMFPALSRLKEDERSAKTMFLNMHKYLAALTFPIVVGLALIAEDAVILLLGEKWAPIAFPLQILCWVGLFQISLMLIAPTLEGMANVKRVLQYNLMALVLLPIAYVIGAQWGLDGVVLGWLASMPLLFAYLFRGVMLTLAVGLVEFFATLSSVVVSLLIMAAIVGLCAMALEDASRLLRLSSCVAVGGMSYFTSFFLIFRSELENIKQGWAILRNPS